MSEQTGNKRPASDQLRGTNKKGRYSADQLGVANRSQLEALCKKNGLRGYSGKSKGAVLSMLLEHGDVKRCSGWSLPTDEEILAKREKVKDTVLCSDCGRATTSLLPNCWGKHITAADGVNPLAMCHACIQKRIKEETQTRSERGCFVMANKSVLKKRKVGKRLLPKESHMKRGGKMLGDVYLYFPEKACFCCDGDRQQ